MRWWVVAVGWVVLAAHVAALQPWTVDDAYVTFRYAEHWAAGHGPVWNPGEWVEGYSSPLWLAALTLAAALGAPTPLAAQALGVACAALVPAALAASARSDREGVIAAALAASSGPLLAWAGGGLEVPLAALAVTLAWIGHRDDRAWAPLAAAVAPLVRPELALLPLVAATDRALAGRARDAALLAAWTLGVNGAHEALRLWAYGDWLPNPFHAKVGATTDQVLRGLGYLRRWAPWGGPAALLAGSAAPDRAHRPLLAWAALHLAAVAALGGDALPAWRFVVPIVPAVAACAAAGLARRPGGLAVAALVAGWQLAAVGLDPREWPRDLDAALVVRGREAGAWLRAHEAPGTTIATNTAGTVPYASGLPAIDLLGLCDRTIARSEPPRMGRGLAGHEKGDGAYVLRRAPELVMFGAAPGRRTPVFRSDRELFADPAFHAAYAPESHRLPSGRTLWLWRRRDAPP